MNRMFFFAAVFCLLAACEEQPRKPENQVIPETEANDNETKDKSRKNKNGETDCSDPSFSGVNRGACKTSVVKGQPELFGTLEEFMSSLPDDDVMSNEAGISTDENSERAEEERRNISIAKCWILAIKRNNDGDYHIIIGSGPGPKCDALFNIEVSGLPESSSPHYAALKKVRDDLENYFNGDCCFTRYKKFYKNPIPVRVTGSLFYDLEHAPPRLNIGPTGLKTTTAWELHPVTAITFL